MGEWKVIKLGEVLKLITKGTTPPKGVGFVDQGINYVKSDAIGYDGKLDRTKFSQIDATTHEKFKRSQLAEGDILYSMAGIYLGKNAIVPKEILPANTNQALAILRLDREKATSKYISYYLSQPQIVDFVNNMSGQSAQPNINFDEIKSIEILVPPLHEQKSISAVLSSLDDKIDLLHRQNTTLEKMAETLFRKWFVEDAKEDWEEGMLRDFGKVITGKTPSKNNPDFWGMKYQFITPTDFKYFGMFSNFTTRFLSEIGWIKLKNLQLPANSILVTCIGSDMGKVCISSESCITNQQLNSVVLKDENYLGYIYEFLKSQYLNLRNIAFGGTTMPIINKTDFENIIVPIPSNELVSKFQDSWSSFSNKIRSNQTQICTLTKLRDTLLPKLMSGEVRVN